MMDDCIGIWVGEFGEYRIPAEVMEGVKLTNTGYPDKRYPYGYHKMMSWVAEQEAAAKSAFTSDT